MTKKAGIKSSVPSSLDARAPSRSCDKSTLSPTFSDGSEPMGTSEINHVPSLPINERTYSNNPLLKNKEFTSEAETDAAIVTKERCCSSSSSNAA